MSDQCAKAMVRYTKMLEAVRDGSAPYACVEAGRWLGEFNEPTV